MRHPHLLALSAFLTAIPESTITAQAQGGLGFDALRFRDGNRFTLGVVGQISLPIAQPSRHWLIDATVFGTHSRNDISSTCLEVPLEYPCRLNTKNSAIGGGLRVRRILTRGRAAAYATGGFGVYLNDRRESRLELCPGCTSRVPLATVRQALRAGPTVTAGLTVPIGRVRFFAEAGFYHVFGNPPPKPGFVPIIAGIRF